MLICLYAHMLIRLYACLYASTNLYIYRYTQRAHAYMAIHTYAFHTRLYLYAYMLICLYARMPICLYACTPICLDAYMVTRLYAYTHTGIHMKEMLIGMQGSPEQT